ncbi:hypothetical protein [Polymorphobacter megasporae]|uniref:hypothetical protein n=1 Tax=Glacieibacterium megasporae TaxID=2835787 RepID=UPI001C1E5D93|nr:hypothetical protein [Polymorphobacter megasporae]UAJ10620.1 hypothetical protein KTC28_02365 [Polymorphobacter megasporae]
MPTQATIAREAGVDQPLVSRAGRGELRRLTDRVRRLCEYAENKAQIIDSGAVARTRRAGRRPSLALEALMDCRNYLKEGFDPTVLREQLKVLRRAQRLGLL